MNNLSYCNNDNNEKHTVSAVQFYFIEDNIILSVQVIGELHLNFYSGRH